MAFLSTFLLNMLCSRYNCEYEHPVPTPSPSLRGARFNFQTDLQQYPPVVVTKSGAVEGFTEYVTNGRDIAAFEGIPFAEPPIGNLRFKDPVPKAPWTGTLYTKAPSPDCLQLRGIAHGREDCLYLNIYTPKIPKNRGKLNYPVIFWIFGGAFIAGAGRWYGPAYLLNRDVILVTSNYRLGVLGFMSTGDEISPGNYGLKDQALAIKWVHDNIEYFGGDPNRISVMGQSSGAGCAHWQIISPTSIARGLIHSAASFSGNAINSWTLELQTPSFARNLTTKMAELVSCPVDSGSAAIVDCFRRTDPNLLVAKQFHFLDVLILPPVIFAPSIEPNITGAFITDTVENYYARNQVSKVPWLCTVTEHEGEMAIHALRNAMLLPIYMRYWRKYMPTLLHLNDKVDNVDYIMDKLTANYFGDQDPSRANPKIWGQVLSDRFFQVSNRKSISYHSKIAPTYSYIFGFTGRIGITQRLTNEYRAWGASHADDLFLIFNASLIFPAIVKGEPEYYMSSILTNLLANFASKGVPYYTNENGTDEIIWEPVKDSDNPKFLRLNTGDIKMIPDPFSERLKIWKSLRIH